VCPACEGQLDECDRCGGEGDIDFGCCPLTVIGRDVWEVIKYAGLFEKGLPPIAGGVLDQAYNFVAAAEFIFGEEQKIKNMLGIF